MKIEIGPHILYHGDCLSLLPELPPVDLVLTDPPYGTTACKWDSVIPLDEMWAALSHVQRDATPVVLCAGQPFTSLLGASNIKELRYSWVWQKTSATGHLNAKRMPMKNHEDVLVFYRKQPTYRPQGLKDYGKLVRRGHNGDCFSKSGTENFQEKTGYPRSVQQFKSEGRTVHPTQKPVALMEHFIRTYTNEGDTVLDFTMGSGTTGVACANTGRKFIGIEKDSRYFGVAAQRIGEALEC